MISSCLDKMKPAALVKISAQCSEYYNEAQKALHRDTVRGTFEKVFSFDFTLNIYWLLVLQYRLYGSFLICTVFY